MATEMRKSRFRSTIASAGAQASITFLGKPGKRYRVVFIDAITNGGTGTSALNVGGLESEDGSLYGLLIPVGQAVAGLAKGLVGKENTDLVVTFGPLATSTPILNVEIIEEPFNV